MTTGRKRTSVQEMNGTVARRCAKEGIPVVPLHGRQKDGSCTCGDKNCRRPGRHPRTKHGVADATTSWKETRRLWKKWPKAKIGIVLGSPGNLVALEARGKKGESRLDDLMWTNQDLPPTVMIQAGDRQFQLFRHRGDHPRRVDLGDGVRMLGDGALIRAPLSTNKSASRHFCSGRAVGEVKIASAPGWLMALGKGTSRAATARGSQSAISHHPIRGGKFAMTATKWPSGRRNATATDDPSSGDTEGGTPHPGAYSRDAVAATNEASVASEKPMTKAELFSTAKIEIERGENSWRNAAEALARAEKEFGATQGEMAEAVGRSKSWVSRLLTWRRAGYKEPGPFGPTTKKERVAHAQQLAAASKGRKGKRSLPVAGSAGAAESAGPGTDETVPEPDHLAELDQLKTELVSMRQNSKEVEAELAATKEHLQQVQAELNSARAEIANVEQLKRERDAATKRVHELEEQVRDAQVGDLTIPWFLDRTPLSTEDQSAVEAIKVGWAKSPEFQGPWHSSSMVARRRFVREILMPGASS
jgi:hypothetical protein